MDNVQTASMIHSGFGFTYFSQSYYFSFGYFGFSKIEYGANCLEGLGDAGLI